MRFFVRPGMFARAAPYTVCIKLFGKTEVRRMKRRRGRVWVLRHEKTLALGAVCLLFAGLIRIFANIGAADGLSRAFRWLADDPARAV